MPGSLRVPRTLAMTAKRGAGMPSTLAMTAWAVTVAAGALPAQDLQRRIESSPDGIVRMSYAAKPGVCGRGENIVQRHGRDDGWESDCDHGPVRVALERADGRVLRVRTYVGGRWTPVAGRVTDLGMVSAPRAAEYLLSLAEGTPQLKGDPIMAAVLADSSVSWPSLLRMARNTSLPKDTRRQAVFWVSQEAGEAATRGLADLAGDGGQDREIREQAVFALSQLPHDDGIPVLIQVARTNKDPDIRRKAIFWLGQSEDPRALALFEELLAGKR
jgi:hypothetical protein